MINFKKTIPSENATRVLVIDDEASFTRMIKLNLEQTGNYRVEVVNDSAEAIEAARAFAPHIVLLDIVMPGQDGGDVAQQLRSRSATRDIPIIFVSAMVSQAESNKSFYESGGEHFLAKPVDTETLCNAIETLLSRA